MKETALLLARLHSVGGRFVASRGFISRWKRSHAVRRIHLNGEAASVDMAEAQGRMYEIHAHEDDPIAVPPGADAVDLGRSIAGRR